MSKLISRGAAKAAGLTRYFTGSPCPHGHVAQRMVSTYACVVCLAEYTKRFWAERPGLKKQWQERVKERRQQQKEARKPRYAERNRAYARRYYRENKEKIAQRMRERPWVSRARVRLRQATQAKATPPWVDVSAIRDIYRSAEEATRATGVLHSVDHIVPLRGRGVCGLHVPWNLQVMTMEENRRKSNRFDAASL
jgi:5-methylcytosine-specific restriction endonuclease McrA